MIFLVTNRHMARGDYLEIIEGAAQGGIDGIILREKDLDYEEVLPLGLGLDRIARDYGLDLIVNSNLRLAEKLGAYSYHTGYENFLSEGRVYKRVGVSVHSLEEARRAEELGADYLLLGHIFETDCKKGLKGRGLDFLEEVRRSVDLPIIAIGGINEENVKDIAGRGVRHIALMSYFMASHDPKEAARLLKEASYDI